MKYCPNRNFFIRLIMEVNCPFLQSLILEKEERIPGLVYYWFLFRTILPDREMVLASVNAKPSSIFYVHIFIARVNLKLLLFIFGHIRKWEIDKISLINAIKWGASILVNEISVYKGRLLDTLLNRSRSRPRTDVHLFHRSSSFLARKKIWSQFVRENYDSDLINSSNEMTPQKRYYLWKRLLRRTYFMNSQ